MKFAVRLITTALAIVSGFCHTVVLPSFVYGVSPVHVVQPQPHVIDIPFVSAPEIHPVSTVQDYIVHEIPHVNVESQTPPDVLSALKIQKELLQLQIDQTLLTQQAEKAIREDIAKLGLYVPDSSSTSDIVGNLIARRDLINAHIEQILAIQQAEKGHVGDVHQSTSEEEHHETPEESTETPKALSSEEDFTDVDVTTTEQPQDLLATLISQKDLINLQIEQVLALRSAEENLRRNIQNLSISEVVSPVKTSGTVQHEEASGEKPADVLRVLILQKDSIDAQIDQIIASRSVQNIRHIGPESEVVVPTSTEYPEIPASKKPVDLLDALIAQRDSLNVRIQQLRDGQLEINEVLTPQQIHELIAVLISQRDLLNVQIEKYGIYREEEQKIRDVIAKAEIVQPQIIDV